MADAGELHAKPMGRAILGYYDMNIAKKHIREVIPLYITSTQLSLLSENELASYERQGRLRLPQQYCDFMSTYGIGTYGGAICIQSPDFDLLKDYSEYDFWQHENAPITQEQLSECALIGNSIDGDFIAIHPNCPGYLLLPRDSETILLIPYKDEKFIDTLIKIGYELYQENPENYFEPAGNKHLFLHSAGKDLHEIADQFKSTFRNDYLIEDEYKCELFFARLGGYVRFNFSAGYETAIFYSDYGIEYLQEIKEFLNKNGCN